MTRQLFICKLKILTRIVNSLALERPTSVSPKNKLNCILYLFSVGCVVCYNLDDPHPVCLVQWPSGPMIHLLDL